MRQIFLAALFFSILSQEIYAQSSMNEAPTVKFMMQGDNSTIGTGLHNLSQTRYGNERIDWQVLKQGEFTVTADPRLNELVSLGLSPVICDGCEAWEVPTTPLLKLGGAGMAELDGIEFCPDCAEVEPLPECSKQLAKLGYSAYPLQATPRYMAQFLTESPVEFEGGNIMVIGRVVDKDLAGWQQADIAAHAASLVDGFCPDCGQVDPLPEGCEGDDE